MTLSKKHGQENDATGTRSTRRHAKIPSIILIRGASISLITLTTRGVNRNGGNALSVVDSGDRPEKSGMVQRQ